MRPAIGAERLACISNNERRDPLDSANGGAEKVEEFSLGEFLNAAQGKLYRNRT
jgi:hypothetical protein